MEPTRQAVLEAATRSPLAAAHDPRPAIIGLGYVGLPLAVAFGRHLPVVGFDIDAARVAALRASDDQTLEVDAEELAAARHLRFSDAPSDLATCNVYIVTVPTPIDAAEQPDLEPLREATRQVAEYLQPGDLVIYESTVYPGTTEEICVPLLEAGSGLRFNQHFQCGYSPERVSPGDRQRRLADIRKITSGSTPEAAAVVDALYARIIMAGTCPVSSMRVAEAAKVVENIQRDVNIALVNELALIFDRLGIDTQDVLDAAGSKWNFLPFRPGLVGGHCIGVDPYYLLHKSESVGYHPDLIHTARQVNNRVGAHVAERVAALLEARGRSIAGARVLVLGITFKEDCPDLRNSRALDLASLMQAQGAAVAVHDPWVGPAALQGTGLDWAAEPAVGTYDAVVLAVAHAVFRQWDAAAIGALGAEGCVVYDVKSAWPREAVDARL